ncbi:Y55_G0057070.mRNA.1.CDS.1 [Saccharomyces cerevisiae]|nr:Y55_G0057070.mRNA.1.CDS.1 [Saccharomyces cerevisiae]
MRNNRNIKCVDFDVIVGIPLLTKAIILGIQNILEVLLEDLGIHKRESAILHNSINIIIIILYVNIH